jgi:hypothetical protein
VLVNASRFFFTHLRECLAAAVLFARLGDILSTRFGTPNLRLEANPVARRLGWPFAWATLLLCGVPYLDWGAGVAVVIVILSLAVASGNVGRAWVMRTVGEDEYLAWVRHVYAEASPRMVYGAIATSSGLFASLGLFTWLFYPTPDEWGFWLGEGFAVTGLAIGVHSCFFARRIFAELRDSHGQGTAAAAAS